MTKSNYNFSNPVEVTEVFRIPESKMSPTNDPIEILELGPPPSDHKMVEFAHKSCFGWERVTGIKQNPHKDDWVKYPGPKYWIELTGANELMLVLGSYESMVRQWMLFRNTYPIFTEDEKTK